MFKAKTIKTSVTKFEYFFVGWHPIFCNDKCYYVSELNPFLYSQTEGEYILPLNSIYNFVMCICMVVMLCCVYLVQTMETSVMSKGSLGIYNRTLVFL